MSLLAAQARRLANRWMPTAPSVCPERSGAAVPWSKGYARRRDQWIAEVLRQPERLDVFRTGLALPDGFGVGLDERCIEQPWAVAQFDRDASRVLDAGSALNHEHVLEHVAGDVKLHIATLGPETKCFWQRGISYLYEDLRAMPVRDGIYDQIVCVSTLEHVGCDNSAYTGDSQHDEDRPGAFVEVMRELRRVLKPEGTLLLTVPFGKYQRFNRFQQFDGGLLDCAIEAFGPCEWEARYYRYLPGGWQTASRDACASCEYVEWITRPRETWPDPIPVEPDGAAAARAVACVRLVARG